MLIWKTVFIKITIPNKIIIKPQKIPEDKKRITTPKKSNKFAKNYNDKFNIFQVFYI